MGLIPLDTKNNTRYMVSPEDFSLTIMDANALDASDAYYCVVDVENLLPRFNSYHSVGPSISLVVTGEGCGLFPWQWVMSGLFPWQWVMSGLFPWLP